MHKIKLDTNWFNGTVGCLADEILKDYIFKEESDIRIYGVPRGGEYVAIGIMETYPDAFKIVSDPKKADVIVDDIIDSGKTKDRYKNDIGEDIDFRALIDKTKGQFVNQWVIFPWETEEVKTEKPPINILDKIDQQIESISDNFLRILQYYEPDPYREGLKETPKRVAKAWAEWTSGYSENEEELFKCFKDGSESYNEMIVVKDIPFYSHCEHHMAPFFGTVSIGYIPDGKIVGLSKLARLVDIYAKRLQVQERLTSQINDAIIKHLMPQGCGVRIIARHLCMESRGIAKQGHETITTAIGGIFESQPSVKAEFLQTIRS